MSLIISTASELIGSAAPSLIHKTPWLNLAAFSSIAGPDVDWLSPDSAEFSDNMYTVSLMGATPVFTDYVKAVNLGLDIPAPSTILGIEARIDRSNASDSVKDTVVSLVVGDVITGDNKANTIDNWPAVDAYEEYGSASDLWGLLLTPSDVNSATFGFVLKAEGSSAITNSALVDHMQMRITFQ